MSFFVNQPTTDAQGEVQVDVKSLPSLPSGGNKLGSVDVNVNLSLLDSTTTALASNSSYTSALFGTSTFKEIVGTAFADTDAVVKVQQSWDGVNWDSVTTINVTANTPADIQHSVVAPNGRLIVENNTLSGQTALRVYVGGKSV